MLKKKRQAHIMEVLIKEEAMSVSELAELLDVSSVTIRKDLNELEQAGKLYRSHGKARIINPFTLNRSVSEKEKMAPEQKDAIGREAAKLIDRDDSIIIASGTTVHALARNIKPIHRLTVVTASLQVSVILSQDESNDIIQLGGMLRHSSLSVVGQYSKSILENCSFSKLFIGVDGIDFNYGFTTTDMREAELNQQMMRAAQKVIVLADSTKFGRRGFAKIGNIEDIDMIITDSGINPNVVKQIKEHGIEVIVAH
ncbi:MAG: DeoR/GlpR family DNA-binding transcription regulator [Bacteroidales bacterium]|nr:DeoR/GlpR transcriptional regulator [Muribaculaceae bacterium]MDY6412634.1 DeoR/GlpR family DNA-binding transcription regulator [Bacteroidales bacterium]